MNELETTSVTVTGLGYRTRYALHIVTVVPKRWFVWLLGPSTFLLRRERAFSESADVDPRHGYSTDCYYDSCPSS